MGDIKNLGMTGLDHVHFAVHDLEASRAFYVERMGFTPLWKSTGAHTEKTGHRTSVLGAGTARIVLSQPVTETSEAGRFLRFHPEGAMAVGFGVTDIAHAHKTLLSRDATPLDDPRDEEGAASFEIATPLGEVLYRFIQRKETGRAFLPGLVPEEGAAQPKLVPWVEIDHLTSNTRTMKPVVDWYRDVMGMTHYWDVVFHTTQTPEGATKKDGTGLKSIVMWDEHSGIKFATNEPLKPFFRQSQIERFVADNHGAGVQHIALSVPDIIEAVDALRGRNLRFLTAPASYYGRLGKRLQSVGWDIKKVREPIAELERRHVLVDACEEGYMLQIFQEELRQLTGTMAHGSPAFYEVIQRAGDRGFGYGNFRALFEAIEAAQSTRAD